MRKIEQERSVQQKKTGKETPPRGKDELVDHKGIWGAKEGWRGTRNP